MKYGAEQIGGHWVVKYPGPQPFLYGPFESEVAACDFARKENTDYEEAKAALIAALKIEAEIQKSSRQHFELGHFELEKDL